MEIKRVGTQSSAEGPTDWFTGTVRIDPLFEAPEPARARGASVTFEPGARTAWHTHPLGQTLIVTVTRRSAIERRGYDKAFVALPFDRTPSFAAAYLHCAAGRNFGDQDAVGAC